MANLMSLQISVYSTKYKTLSLCVLCAAGWAPIFFRTSRRRSYKHSHVPYMNSGQPVPLGSSNPSLHHPVPIFQPVPGQPIPLFM